MSSDFTFIRKNFVGAGDPDSTSFSFELFTLTIRLLFYSSDRFESIILFIPNRHRFAKCLEISDLFNARHVLHVERAIRLQGIYRDLLQPRSLCASDGPFVSVVL
jgi:hypothetical protein